MARGLRDDPVTYARIARGLAAKYGVAAALWKARGRQMRYLYVTPFLAGQPTREDWARAYRWVRIAEILTHIGEGKSYA